MSVFREILDPTKSLSFGRFMALVMTMFVLGWDSGVLIFAWRANQHLPPGTAPFSLLPDAITLGAQGLFCTLFYGVTKVGDITGTKVNGNVSGQ